MLSLERNEDDDEEEEDEESDGAESNSLRRLVDGLIVSLRLEQHFKVADLALQVAKCLVDLFEQSDHEELQEFHKTSKSFSSAAVPGFCLEWHIVDNLCDSLRKLSQLAQCYGELVEFVRVRDLVCLGKVVQANRVADPISSSLGATHYDNSIKTVRQAVLLLKSLRQANRETGGSTADINEGDENAAEIMLNSKWVTRVSSIGFPQFIVDLAGARAAGQLDPSGGRKGSHLWQLLEELRNRESTKVRPPGPLIRLMGQVRSRWFLEFVSNSLLTRYPLDRFVILVALYIVGMECEHKLLCSLMAELVDQIHHQEANSCLVEEFMQLTQVGAFWLSYLRRFHVTFRQRDTTTDYDAATTGDLSMSDGSQSSRSIDDPLASESSSSSSPSSPMHRKTTEQAPAASKTTGSGGARCKAIDLKARLRREIDEQLIVGVACVLCGRPPSGDLLAPIQQGPRCANCSLMLSQRECAISYEPIEWLSLGELLINLCGQNLTKLLIVTPNEWTQSYLRAGPLERKLEILTKQSRRRLRNGPPSTGGGGSSSEDDELPGERSVRRGGERLDVNENFERLTMVPRRRRSKAEAQDAGQSSSESASEGRNETRRSSSEADDESDRQSSEQQVTGRLRQSGDKISVLQMLLKDFIKFRLRDASNSINFNGDNHHCFSESFLLLEWLHGAPSGGGAMNSRERNRFKGAPQQQETQDARMPKKQLDRLQVVAICSSDLFALNSMEVLGGSHDKLHSLLIKVRTRTLAPPLRGPHIIGSRRSNLRPESSNKLQQQQQPLESSDSLCSILVCQARSPSSQLILGCGRLFKPLELIKSAARCQQQQHQASGARELASEGQQGDSNADESNCPFCSARLATMRDAGQIFV